MNTETQENAATVIRFFFINPKMTATKNPIEEVITELVAENIEGTDIAVRQV